MKLSDQDILMTIFAHQDDETFSAGGVLAKYPNSYAVSITKDNNRIEEFKQACHILSTEPIQLDFENITQSNKNEIKSKLIEIILKIKPTHVITHLDFDYHEEHKLTRNIVEEAIEWASHDTNKLIKAHQVSKLYAAETTILIPFPHFYVDITKENEARLNAIKVYESQSHKGGEGFYSNFHNKRTALRGVQAATDHAEAYLSIPISISGSFKPIKNYNYLP